LSGNNPEKLMLGAVEYDPKVKAIWDGFKGYFVEHGLPFDFILYPDYDKQVEGLVGGDIHVAWNSPLAWLNSQRLAAEKGLRVRAIAMRDTDCDLSSFIVVRADSPIREIEDLKGKVVAVGAADSPQATLIPLAHLQRLGLDIERDFGVLRHEVGVGLHGDHIGGERDAAISLMQGRADAACMIEGNYYLFQAEGTLPKHATRVLTQTSRFDHCNFTVISTAPHWSVARFRDLLFSMSYDDPKVKSLMDMEGLKSWKEGRTDGYGALEEAVSVVRSQGSGIGSRESAV
jgi:ABC-type phosphate/phosphonate transport system substrate-binding protein